MRAWRIGKRLAILLCMGMSGMATSGPAFSETWQVTSGPDGSEHAVWTLDRSASNGLHGGGEVTKADGSKASQRVLGTAKQLLVTEQPSGVCIYAVQEASPGKVSGARYCGEATDSWSATIGDPTDMSAPVLLKAHEDPRATAAYKALTPEARGKAEGDTRQYMFDESPNSWITATRDMDCLAGQFLNIRVQKPAWTEQDIDQFIQFTCIDPQLVHKYALSRCARTFAPSTTGEAAPGNDPNFCPCYADHFTNHFVGQPNNTGAGETQMVLLSASECRKHE